ncbi:MAG: hypothetical protein VZR54_06230 [Ruminococcus sp.]|nr:hypothetical protein [Ruminococcus sp.]
MSIVKRKIDVPDYIDGHQPVTLKSMGNIQKITITNSLNRKATVIPLSKNDYIVVSTGEVKKVEHHAEDRTENLRNLEKSMRALSDLINANISPENAHFCRFITLTYKENIQNPEQLYKDFRNFNKRVKRFMEKQNYHYEYIVTVEAQERGAFHLHCIFIFDKKAPYIDNSKLAEIWGLGFVSVKAIDNNVDNIGKYLTAYLTDLPIDNNADISTDVIGGTIKDVKNGDKTKRIIKGARLKLLPVGIRLFRYSRGIKKPIVYETTYNEAVKALSDNGYKKVAEYAVEIFDTERNFTNRYIKENYKKFINTKGVKNHDT